MMKLTDDRPVAGPAADQQADQQADQRDAVEEFGRWLQESLDDVDDISHQLERVDPFLSTKLDGRFNLAQAVFETARSQLSDPTIADDHNLRSLLDHLVFELRDSYLAATVVLARGTVG